MTTTSEQEVSGQLAEAEDLGFPEMGLEEMHSQPCASQGPGEGRDGLAGQAQACLWTLLIGHNVKIRDVDF